jgi:hypothetical protein
MTDWATISSLATAGGTLVLAIATFASVRSANRSTRLAEVSLREQLRPVLVNSRLDDPEQKIMFSGGHWVRVRGSGAVVEHEDGVVYLALSMRNVGAGIAVLQGWHPWRDLQMGMSEHPPLEHFRTQQRDLYIPAGDVGLWQGALRDSDEEMHAAIASAAVERQPFTIDLLYSDHIGDQQTISRFSFFPMEEGPWIGAVSRHWHLDGAGPRERPGAGPRERPGAGPR